MAHLKFLLASREGRQYVALCLVDALQNNKEIHPGPPHRGPYLPIALNGVSRKTSEEILQKAHLVLQVCKSRDTDEGWVVVENMPSEFIKRLPPSAAEMDEQSPLVIMAKERLEEIIRLKRGKEGLEERVEELKVLSKTHQLQLKKLEEELYIRDKRIEELKALAQKLEGENSYYHAHAEVTGRSLHELQMENMKLQEENRELKKGRPLPDFVGWWRAFGEDTRQNLYAKFPCGDLPVNSANRTARTILEWMAKDDCSASWDRYMAAEPWKKKLMEAEDRVKGLNQALDNYTLSCASCRKVTPVIDDEWVCKACHGTVKDHAHKAIDEEHGTIKFHDRIIDRILDILEPEFYDPTTPAAQSGYDYEAMFKGLGLMRARALDEDLEEDFAEKVAGFIAHGMTDEEILDQVAEDDHIDLVALIRTLMEKK